MGPGLGAGFKVTLVVGGTCSGEEIAFCGKRRTLGGTAPVNSVTHLPGSIPFLLIARRLVQTSHWGTGGRLASDHGEDDQKPGCGAGLGAPKKPEAKLPILAQGISLASPPRNGLDLPGWSPSLPLRRLRGLRPRGGLPAPQDPPPAGFCRIAAKTRKTDPSVQPIALLQKSIQRLSDQLFKPRGAPVPRPVTKTKTNHGDSSP